MGPANSTKRIMLGCFPHPNDSYNSWELRWQRLRQASEKCKQQFALNCKPNESIVPDTELLMACQYLKSACGVAPTWACAVYSAQGLGWLHLGALAVDEDENTPFIQLHSRWKDRSSWLHYDRTAVLAHELIHYIRYGLDDGKYEEFMAYSLEKRKYRQLLGPFFSEPSTAATVVTGVFLFSLGLWCIWIVIEELFFENLQSSIWFLGVLFLLLGIGLLAATTLVFLKRQYIWGRFCKHAHQLLNNARKEMLFSLMLSTEAIEDLSELKPSQWLHWVEELPDGPYKECLRELLTNHNAFAWMN